MIIKTTVINSKSTKKEFGETTWSDQGIMDDNWSNNRGLIKSHNAVSLQGWPMSTSLFLLYAVCLHFFLARRNFPCICAQKHLPRDDNHILAHLMY